MCGTAEAKDEGRVGRGRGSGEEGMVRERQGKKEGREKRVLPLVRRFSNIQAFLCQLRHLLVPLKGVTRLVNTANWTAYCILPLET